MAWFLYRKSQRLYKKALETLINEFTKVARVKSQYKKSLVFLYASNEHLGTKLKKQYHNVEILRFKSNKMCAESVW